MWEQIVEPDLSAEDYPGYCLRFTQKVYHAPARYATAWDSWVANPDKYETRDLPSVSVPVFFDHWGTYGGEYGQYGHVCAYIPGKGFLNQGERSYGQKYYSSLEEVERVCNAKYVGYSSSLNGLQIAKIINDPTPTQRKTAMGAFYRANDGEFNGAIFYQEKPNSPLIGIDLPTWNAYAANGNKYADMSTNTIKDLIKKFGSH